MRQIQANKWQLTVEWTVTTGGLGEVAVGVLDVAAVEEVVAGAEVAGALEAWQQRPGVVSSPKRRASVETPPKRSWKRVAKMCAFARILLSTGVVQLPATILSALQRSRACEIILSPNPYPLLCRSLSHSHSSDVSSSIHSPFYILACFVGLMALLFCHLACLTLRRFLCVTDRFRRVPTALGLMTPRE